MHTIEYEVYFRRPDDCVIYAPAGASREISLLHRRGDGTWHCALCGATECRHTDALQAKLLATDPAHETRV